MKVILYARFSPRPNADECDSVEKQIADMREYCQRNKHEIVAEFFDKALSGADDDRPGLADAFSNLRRGYALVVRSLDRLARDNLMSEVYRREIARRGAFLLTLDGIGVADETAEQAFMRMIFQAQAEYQRRKIRETTSARMRQHQANGRRMSARTPYGVVADPARPGMMIEDAEEQANIARILELRRQGLGYREISRKLNEQGITCRGGRWNHVTVMRIIARAESAALAR